MPYSRNNSGGTDLANTPEVIQLRAQIAQLSAKVAAGPDLSGIYSTLASLQNQINALGPTAPITITGIPGAATVSTAYSFIPTVSGGSGVSRVFSITGTLPAGLSFNTTTGAITGTPTTAQTVSGLSIGVTDSSGSATLSGLSITVSSGSVTPTLTLTGPLAYMTSSPQGTTVVATVGGLAPGETVSSVNVPQLAVSGANVVVGLGTQAAGNLAFIVTTSTGRTIGGTAVVSVASASNIVTLGGQQATLGGQLATLGIAA